MKNLKKAAKIEKVFVEPDEEIVFTLEKILNSDGTRAVLVIPHNAALITSSISLKILARQLAKSDKLVVLVSDTETGLKLAAKASLVAKKRISEVDKTAWEKAKELKESWLLEKARIKKELISARSGAELVPESGTVDADAVAAESLKQGNKATIKDEKIKATVVDEEVETVPVLIPEKQRL